MNKQTNSTPEGYQEQANSITSYNLRELLEPMVNEFGKQRVLHKITKAADNGAAAMQRVLGAMYDVGIVVEQDSKKAARWYMKSAKLGYCRGQFSLGYAYYMGRGIKQNKSKAIYWLKKAAKQGRIEAQCLLCNMYRSGDGVAKSTLNAFSWYESKKYAKLKKQLKRKETELAEKDAQIAALKIKLQH